MDNPLDRPDVQRVVTGHSLLPDSMIPAWRRDLAPMNLSADAILRLDRSAIVEAGGAERLREQHDARMAPREAAQAAAEAENAERREAEALSDAERRAVLCEAIEAHGRAEARLSECEINAERAAARMAAADQELASYADLDAELIAW